MPISICGGCRKVFVSTSLFDAHRIGAFEKPVYAAVDVVKKKPVGYQSHSRRCMTTDELRAAGYQMECRPIPVFHEGHARRVECEMWYDPTTREHMRQAFEEKETPLPPAAPSDDPIPQQTSLW